MANEAKIARVRLADAIRHLGTKRNLQCRRSVIGHGGIQLQKNEKGAIRLVGVSTCGSVHSCPLCAPAIYTRRSEEITTATRAWREQGGFVYMMTNTVRHSMGDELKWMRTRMSKAFSQLWNGRAGKSRVARMGKKHHIRRVEVTTGENGFHPHVHTLLFVDRQMTDEMKQELRDAWKDAVELRMGSDYVPNDERGTTVELSSLDAYISKLGLELSDMTTKKAKGTSRSMWQVAQDAADGDMQSAGIWSKYAKAMLGCRSLCWSPGARKYFRLARITDERLAELNSLADGEPSGVATCLARWENEEWKRQAKARYWLLEVVTATAAGASAIAALPGQIENVPRGAVTISREKVGSIRMSMPKWSDYLSQQQKGIENARERLLAINPDRQDFLNRCRNADRQSSVIMGQN